VLPLDVGELGVDIPLDQRLLADERGEVAKAPGDVAIAAARGDAAVFRVDQRGGALNAAGAVIEPAARLRFLDDLGNVLPRSPWSSM
jgi:hypothetical protein